MAKGTYEELGAIIRVKKSLSPVIDAYKLIDEVDISQEPQEEKDRELLMYRVANALAANGFRAIVKRTGIYVDTSLAVNQTVKEKLISNLKDDIKNKEAVIEAVQKVAEQRDFNQIGGQGVLIFEGSEYHLSEELSDEEIVDILSQIAV